MPSIFRPANRKKFYVAYRDPATGRRVVVPGYRDRRATLALAARCEIAAARAAEGIAATPRPELVPLVTYEAEMIAAGRSAVWCRTTRQRLAAILRDVDLRDVPALVRWIAARSPVGKTRSQYRATVIRYAARCGIALHVPRFSATDATRTRRALTPDEVSALLRRAPASRRLVYLVAVATGLRKGELRRLQWRDVGTDRVSLRVAATKSLRADAVPLRADVAAALRAARPRDADPSSRVFASIPRQATWQRDLAAAGIAYRDAADRVADFHALRYTLCTMLAVAGVSLRHAMAIMRHRDARMTTRIYTDATQLDTAAAVAKLPIPRDVIPIAEGRGTVSRANARANSRENPSSRSGGTGRRARLRANETTTPRRKSPSRR